jgi:hypothetical protein
MDLCGMVHGLTSFALFKFFNAASLLACRMVLVFGLAIFDQVANKALSTEIHSSILFSLTH